MLEMTMLIHCCFRIYEAHLLWPACVSLVVSQYLTPCIHGQLLNETNACIAMASQLC